MALDPVAVALKFGFLAVLYLFLLWMARSALKDLRTGSAGDGGYAAPDYEDATGMHVASDGLGGDALRAVAEGFLVKPPNFDPNKKYPVKFIVHGGPEVPFGDEGARQDLVGPTG